MSTSTSTSSSQVCSEPKSAPMRRVLGGRLARSLAAVLLALTLGAASCRPAPPPKQPPHGTARVCFQAVGDIGYGPFYGIYNRPVRVDAWVNGAAQEIMTFTPNTRGCLSIKLPAKYSWRFRVYHKEANYYWVGRSDWRYVKAGGSYNFGTVTIQSIYAG